MKVKKAKKVKKFKKTNNVSNVARSQVRTRDLSAIVVDTLRKNLKGVYDLPAMQTKYLSGPKAKLGLHLEYYIPVISRAPFYQNDDPKAQLVFENQASQIVQEIVLGQFPIKEEDIDLPLCKECE